MTTTTTKLEEAFKQYKKYWIAELLCISRPTLDSKLKNNNFSEADVKILIDNNVIQSDPILEKSPKRSLKSL